MTTGLTQLTLWNRALDLVGQYPLQSTTDASPYARWLTRNVATLVQAELEANVWSFACRYSQLNADPATPAFRWSYSYTLPPNCIRVLPLTVSGERNGARVPHEVKGGKLFTDEAPPLNVELVFNEQDPNQWTALFADLITARTAHGLAMRFVKTPRVLNDAKEALTMAEARASDINTREGDPEPVEQYDIVRARY